MFHEVIIVLKIYEHTDTRAMKTVGLRATSNRNMARCRFI